MAFCHMNRSSPEWFACDVGTYGLGFNVWNIKAITAESPAPAAETPITTYYNRGGEVWEAWLGGEREVFASDLIERLQILEERAIAAEDAFKAQYAGHQLTAKMLGESQAKLATAREALEPFGKIVPSSFFMEDGTDGEGYRVVLSDHPADTDITGDDIARARKALTATQ